MTDSVEKPEPIVALSRKKFEIPAVIFRRRDFVKFMKGEIIEDKGKQQVPKNTIYPVHQAFCSTFGTWNVEKPAFLLIEK